MHFWFKSDRRPKTSPGLVFKLEAIVMAGFGVTVLVASLVALIIKFVVSYIKNLKFNSRVHSPGIPYPVKHVSAFLKQTFLRNFGMSGSCSNHEGL